MQKGFRLIPSITTNMTWQLKELKEHNQEELQELVQSWGEKAFHGRQIFAALFRRGVKSVDEMTDLSLKLRDKLESHIPFDLLAIEEIQQSSDSAVKALFKLRDNQYIESVWMPEESHATQCLSTQVGCPLDCSFCATGKMGFIRNLTAGEIVDQVIVFGRERHEPQLRNIVFMGMGEPLLNYDNLVKAIRILSHENGLKLSQRRMTVSTAGIVPFINQLADEGLNVKLAISLNAPTDELRNQLMPINKKYPIDEVITAAKNYQKKNGFRITFEYALMPGINDTPEMIERLKDWITQVPAKLNLIPINPIDGMVNTDIDWDRIFDRFYAVFQSEKVPLTMRRSRGSEIQAACGQLAGKKR